MSRARRLPRRALRRHRPRSGRAGAGRGRARVRRSGHAGAERGHLPGQPAHRGAAAGRVATRHGRQPGRQPRAAARLHPLLKCAPRGGRVVVIGSKNVPAPGPGAAAYSASKAALTQLARVAALEWGGDGIRVNVVHPNAVFDTGIWTDEVLAAARRATGSASTSTARTTSGRRDHQPRRGRAGRRDVRPAVRRAPPAPRCRSTAATTV